MDIILANSTKDERVNQILCGLIGMFETVFPNRISGYYVKGSYSDETGIEASDIDITIMFKKFSDHLEQNVAVDLLNNYSQRSSLELDVDITDEGKIIRNVKPNFKLGSFLAYGTDIRDTLPLMLVKDWARERMHASYWLITNLFNRVGEVSLPLDFPNPEDEFYGYTQRQLKLATGEEVSCTRDLVRVIGWSATALIALKGERYVARKKDCHIIYREAIGDTWSDFIEDLYIKCRNDWNYLIPVDNNDRKKLKDICLRTLEFENYFLKVYKEFLLSELQGSNC